MTPAKAMRSICVLAVVCSLFAGCRSLPSTRPPAPTSVAVIPAPVSVETLSGSFILDAHTRVTVAGSGDSEWIAGYFVKLLQSSRGLALPIAAGANSSIARGGIAFAIDAAAPVTSAEGYSLTVTPQGATVLARDRRGLFYGAITLWELLTADVRQAARISVPAVRIIDAPRFRWRGVMLDSARHYQSPEFIEHFVDAMAIHKLNVLHWHLTDDQGWRLEIKKYPRLTAAGAWRVPAGHAAASDIDSATGKPRLYGGFYSQGTVRRIVAYAAERGVTIVPEIEMPGHATAAIVAYPALGVTETPPTAVPSDWGIYPNLYNAEESTFGFLEDVLDETMALFPGEYIHVGGDEAVKDQWHASPRIQERMRELGVANEAQLQSYFVHRMEEYLRAHGRRLIGWDEILDRGIAPDATVMSWRGIDGALTAAHGGHDAVLSPWPTLYLDNRQSEAATDPPGRGRVISLEDMYRFNPIPAALSADEERRVLGLQADAWTEHMRTTERLEFMTFPRAAAVAEVGWSPADRLDWNDFLTRLVPQFDRYRALGIGHANSVFNVRIDAQAPVTNGSARVRLSNQGHYGEIRYTLDGSAPTVASTRYQDEFDTGLQGEIRAATFQGDHMVSAIAARKLDASSMGRRTSRDLKLCSERLAIALEDDAPLAGDRAVFMIDLMNPCWIYQAADLSSGATLSAAVGQLPFNFQIGDDVHKIEFHKPQSAAGELEVRIDSCDGERIAVLPLAPAARHDDVTVLPAARIEPLAGRHDLCLTFTQNGVEPLWAIDRISLDR